MYNDGGRILLENIYASDMIEWRLSNYKFFENYNFDYFIFR